MTRGTTPSRSRLDARNLARQALALRAAQKLGELSPFISFLKRRVLRTVVEIGTARGGTLFVWCQLAEPDALIVSIDLPGGPFGGGYKESRIPQLQAYAQPEQQLHLLRLDSHEPTTRQRLTEILAGREVDFLMIDGDHSYTGVRQDFELYSGLVKNRGLIAFHDIVHHDQVPECEVDAFWNEVKNDFRHREFISDGEVRSWGNWGGIGVLYYVKR